MTGERPQPVTTGQNRSLGFTAPVCNDLAAGVRTHREAVKGRRLTCGDAVP